MGKQRMFDTDFWTDTWVVDSLEPLEAYLFVYLFTNPHTNLAGVYELSLRIMAFESKLEKNQLLPILEHLEPKVLYRNGWVIMRNGVKNQNYRNSKIKTGILSNLATVPSEIIQHVIWPNDFGQERPRGNTQIVLLDDSSMTLHDPLHLIEIETVIETKTITQIDAADSPPLGTRTGSKEIDAVMAAWNEMVGLEIQNDDRQRKSISRLIKQRGIEKTLLLVKGVSQTLDDRYAPRISDFPSLVRKQNDLILWGRKRGNNNVAAQF